MSISQSDQERIAVALARAERLRCLRGKWAASEGRAEVIESICELRVAFPQRPLSHGILVPMPEPRSPRREGDMAPDDRQGPWDRWRKKEPRQSPQMSPRLAPGAGAEWFKREKKREYRFYHTPKGRRAWVLAHREVEAALGWPA